MKTTTTTLIIALFFQSIITSQNNIVTINKNNLNTSYLTEGKKQYLVYRESKDGDVLDISIWERTIKFSKLNNKDAIVIEQHWKKPKAEKFRTVYSICQKENFYPIYHYAKVGTTKKDAFDFTSNHIKGSDSIIQNSKKDFYLKLKEPTLNWELDLETFQCLPLKKNTTFRINFYHPGSPNGPNYYNYEVIGEDTITIGSADKVDCWLLKIKYERDNHAIFWIDKNNREVLKMVEVWDGIKRYKIKLF
ncbi:hypothetical protein [uncultured Psychroserpens sp.]|uniref:DUF3108 domain-containing protein n=1 Tax=uncultured Psychroserpens sp. TaxID=255436 RepID=UPI002614B2C2|nr:hypothetical protein [uncultured Psychroserpens sp.]